jgi:hypothetical protein
VAVAAVADADLRRWRRLMLAVVAAALVFLVI